MPGFATANATSSRCVSSSPCIGRLFDVSIPFVLLFEVILRKQACEDGLHIRHSSNCSAIKLEILGIFLQNEQGPMMWGQEVTIEPLQKRTG